MADGIADISASNSTERKAMNDLKTRLLGLARLLAGTDLYVQADDVREAIAEIERLRAAADGARVGADWQPIETAPKDGSLVDLWTYWPEHDRWRREAGCGWVDGDWHNGTWAFHQYEQPPTASHWMPLPKPPTDDLIVGSDVGSTAPVE